MNTFRMRNDRAKFTNMATCCMALSLCEGCQGELQKESQESRVATASEALGEGPARLRDFIGQQVGGLDKLRVPADNASLPAPPEDPMRPGRYVTTEAKRYLGKLLFHDPVRTARININQGQPVDLPAGTAFGGSLNCSQAAPNTVTFQSVVPSECPTVMTADIAAIVAATKQTGSCGSCHLGEVAAKAGQVLNLHVGAEGRGYTDVDGNFIPRRRVQPILTKVRSAPLFPGDALVDVLPTLTDIDLVGSQIEVNNPSSFYHTPPPDALVATGRLDELDSVGRESPALVGFAFNNRLLLGGLAGEPTDAPGSLNPLHDPAGENITLLLLDAHRMLHFQSAELLKVPAFVKLFQDAFPDEAAQAATANDPTLLVNDETELRATATFLRTVVTRNTPFDHFLAGDDDALTPRQRRGARLFFAKAESGGAGCFTCHSGPMLNKQVNDPDVAGIGQFVEENFVNVGIGDHPLQALNAQARHHDTNYHAEDTGREDITRDPEDAFKFRVLTLRQLKGARTFFHNASFSEVGDIVNYFNAGVPQDPTAGAAPSLDSRFTHPRGANAPAGLGLSDEQVDALTDFLENGLYDPAFVHYDANSTTDTFQPNERDLTYSTFRPDLAALGAKDGLMPSGLAIDSNDPLARRDEGLEFLDVTQRVRVDRIDTNRSGHTTEDVYRLTNNSDTVVDTHLLIIIRGLEAGIRLNNESGTTHNGEPYVRVFLPEGVLQPGQQITQPLVFGDALRRRLPAYTITLLSGQGTP